MRDYKTAYKCLRTYLNENNEEVCIIRDAYNNEFELSTEELREHVFNKEIGLINVEAFNDDRNQLRVEFSHPFISKIAKYRLLEPINSKISIEEIEKEYKQLQKLKMLGVSTDCDKNGVNTNSMYDTLFVTDNNRKFYRETHANTAIFSGRKHLEFTMFGFGDTIKIICKHAIIKNITAYPCIIPIDDVNSVIIKAKYIDLISEFVSIDTVDEIFTILRTIVSQGLVSSYKIICVDFEKVGITSKMVYERVWKLLVTVVDGSKSKCKAYETLFKDRFLKDDQRYPVLLIALIQLSVSMYISTGYKNKDFFYVIDKCNEELDNFIEMDNEHIEMLRTMSVILLKSRDIVNELVEKVKLGQKGEQLIEN